VDNALRRGSVDDLVTRLRRCIGRLLPAWSRGTVGDRTGGPHRGQGPGARPGYGGKIDGRATRRWQWCARAGSSAAPDGGGNGRDLNAQAAAHRADSPAEEDVGGRRRVVGCLRIGLLRLLAVEHPNVRWRTRRGRRISARIALRRNDQDKRHGGGIAGNRRSSSIITLPGGFSRTRSLSRTLIALLTREYGGERRWPHAVEQLTRPKAFICKRFGPRSRLTTLREAIEMLPRPCGAKRPACPAYDVAAMRPSTPHGGSDEELLRYLRAALSRPKSLAYEAFGRVNCPPMPSPFSPRIPRVNSAIRVGIRIASC